MLLWACLLMCKIYLARQESKNIAQVFQIIPRFWTSSIVFFPYCLAHELPRLEWRRWLISKLSSNLCLLQLQIQAHLNAALQLRNVPDAGSLETLYCFQGSRSWATSDQTWQSLYTSIDSYALQTRPNPLIIAYKKAKISESKIL